MIAPRRTRRVRARAFQAYVLIASAAFLTLAVVCHRVLYFPLDLHITQALQSYHGIGFDRLMYGMSWLGFPPQVILIASAIAVALFLVGLRWEACVSLFAMLGAAVCLVVKLLVYRPRPSVDLVHVLTRLPYSVSQLPDWSFPSGHVVEAVTVLGYLFFLAFTLLKRSPWRTLLLAAIGLMIAAMGPSRIYEGHHWFSDVMGGYLLGSLWLTLTIRIHLWGKPRFFVTQPVAPPENPTPR